MDNNKLKVFYNNNNLYLIKINKLYFANKKHILNKYEEICSKNRVEKFSNEKKEKEDQIQNYKKERKLLIQQIMD